MLNRWNRSAALALSAVAAFWSSTAHAVTIDTTWIGGDVQASWFSATKWSNGIPNNSGSTTFQAIINSVSPDAGPIVTVSQNTSIDSLTIGSGAQVRHDSLATFRVANGVSGAGTFQLSFESTLTGLNGPLMIGGGITVNAGGATIGIQNQPLDNYGKIIGGSLLAGNPIRNHGQIGNAILLGTYSLEGLGQLTGSSYTTMGTLLNDGATLSVRAGTPSWTLSGTIQGGTIETGDGLTIRVPYVFAGPGGLTNIPRLDHVVMNADLVMDNNTLTIGGGSLTGHGSILLYPLAGYSPARVMSDSTRLTVDTDITIRSGGRSSGTIGWGGSVGRQGSFTTLTNHGTLRADPPMLFGYATQELDLFGESIFNDGKLVIGDKGLIYAARDTFNFPFNTTFTFGTGGVLDVDLSATAGLGLFQVNGTLDLTTPGDSLLLASTTGIQPNMFYRIVTTTAGITGQFDSVTPGFEVEYRNGTEIWARFVPEPTTAGIICLATCTLVGTRRRRS